MREGVGIILARRGSLAWGKRPRLGWTFSSSQGSVSHPSPHSPEQSSLPASRRKLSAAAQPQGCPRPPAYLWAPGSQSCLSSGGQSAWRRGPPLGAGEEKGLRYTEDPSPILQVSPQKDHTNHNSHQPLRLPPERSRQLVGGTLETNLHPTYPERELQSSWHPSLPLPS